MADFFLLIVAIAGVWLAIYFWVKSIRLKRAEFIRTYQWPPSLLDKLEQKHPALTRKDTALVSRGLRQFFIAHLMSGYGFVSMPSQVVDDLWHEFILYTRDYKQFCDRAFGRFMHHTPAVVLGPESAETNDGLRRTWWFACKDENIDPKRATRLPLLFALDGKLQILNGFRYDLHCDLLRKDGSSAPTARPISSLSGLQADQDAAALPEEATAAMADAAVVVVAATDGRYAVPNSPSCHSISAGVSG
ncbi:MAG TPA: hypothetical protein VJ790_07805 [Dongiaceae bacterium]|nr:hypothetical protein [Dongiaceae bacterium]